jgi:hypothetical protein
LALTVDMNNELSKFEKSTISRYELPCSPVITPGALNER